MGLLVEEVVPSRNLFFMGDGIELAYSVVALIG